MVKNTISPNQMLNADTKNTTAITISTRVGIIENNMYESRLLMESVPLSITRKTSPVLRLKCHRMGKLWRCLKSSVCNWKKMYAFKRFWLWQIFRLKLFDLQFPGSILLNPDP